MAEGGALGGVEGEQGGVGGDLTESSTKVSSVLEVRPQLPHVTCAPALARGESRGMSEPSASERASGSGGETVTVREGGRERERNERGERRGGWSDLVHRGHNIRAVNARRLGMARW